MKNHLQDIVTYNLWANRRIINFLQQNSEEGFTQPMVNSFSSIQKTLHHYFGAEKLWLERLQGKSLPEFPTFEGSIIDQHEKCLAVSKNFLAFIKNQPEDFFSKNCIFEHIDGTSYEVPIQKIIHHVVNHSTYHRGQIITLGNQANFSKIVGTDFITYESLK